MSKKAIFENNELNLFILFKVIWDGKIKILLITIISFLIGFGYLYQKPKIYINSFEINQNSNLLKLHYLYKFVDFNKYNNLDLVNQENDLGSQTNYDYTLNKYILDRFIVELININKSRKKKLDLFIKFENPTKIDRLINQSSYYALTFEWNNPDDAKKIFQDLLTTTLNSFNESFLEELKKKIEIEKKFIIAKDNERIDFLLEQSLIAKELEISDNQIDTVNLSQPSILFNINGSSPYFSYYLRGFRAIDKEIELIKNRKYSNFELLNKEINYLKEEKIQWAKFDINSMNSKFLDETRKILVISILLGLIFGIFYVCILNTTQFIKKNK